MDISTTQVGCFIVSDIVNLVYHAWPSSTRLWLAGKTTKGDGFGGQWYFDADSMATHDGYDVLRQSVISSGDPGRWLRELENSNWSESDSTKKAYINNKPSLATVATSGAYGDLSGKPSLATVATTGAYADLTGKPSLAAVATSGAYGDLSGTPSVSPIGSILAYGGSSAPTGYLLCDGAAVLRTGIYAPLFAILGTSYGIGDNSTTFNLPNLQGRFPLGKAASGTGNTLGATGGTIDHLHTVDPPSTSTSSDGSHNHTGVTGTPSATAQATALGPAVGSGTHTHSISTDGTHTHFVDITQFNTGTNNPPFQVVNYILKYLA